MSNAGSQRLTAKVRVERRRTNTMWHRTLVGSQINSRVENFDNFRYPRLISDSQRAKFEERRRARIPVHNLIIDFQV
jgi:hypothetical protein